MNTRDTLQAALFRAEAADKRARAAEERASELERLLKELILHREHALNPVGPGNDEFSVRVDHWSERADRWELTLHSPKPGSTVITVR